MSAAEDTVVLTDAEKEAKAAADAAEAAKAQPSFLSMSDEELLNAPPPEATAATVPAAEDDAGDANDDENDAGKKKGAEDAVPEEARRATEQAAADAAAAEEAAKAAKEKKDEKLPEAGDDKSKEDGKQKTDEAAKDDKSKEAAPINFEAEYNRLLAPFKANGREISVANVDDAITLMQMGANYNKKMAALKPNLKLMKMLENNGFMSEEKISFLIDLGKKDPAAINKLVKDSGIDPMDLDAEKASAYKQSTYAVDDRELELDTVLDELQGSPTYTRTLDVVSNKWDVASKQVVSQSPQLLKVINDHMASGIYDLISKEVESQRLFGRLSGLSDIEAYRQVGDAIQARKGFDHLVQSQAKPKTEPPVVVTPKPKVDDDALKAKKRAASATPPAAPSTTPKDFNPLSLSDAEFTKLGDPKFL